MRGSRARPSGDNARAYRRARRRRSGSAIAHQPAQPGQFVLRRGLLEESDVLGFEPVARGQAHRRRHSPNRHHHDDEHVWPDMARTACDPRDGGLCIGAEADLDARDATASACRNNARTNRASRRTSSCRWRRRASAPALPPSSSADRLAALLAEQMSQSAISTAPMACADDAVPAEIAVEQHAHLRRSRRMSRGVACR